MSYTSEHRRSPALHQTQCGASVSPVLAKARQLDIVTDLSPEALYESLTAGIYIWCTPEDHPLGWDGIPLIAGAFAKPCGFVGTATWKWEGERIVAVSLGTDAYDLADNRPEDLEWAERKIRWLFEQAGVPCPPIVVE